LQINKLGKEVIKMKQAIIKRLRNKPFWVAITSAIILLAQQLGLDIFPKNIGDIVNTVLYIFTIMGVIIDPSTKGLKDGVKNE
jgi:phi LC3 family holin